MLQPRSAINIGFVVAAKQCTHQRDSTQIALPAQRAFAADGAQLVADPAVDGRRRQGIGAGPAEIVILQADGGKEGAPFHRPGKIAAAGIVVAQIGFQRVHHAGGLRFGAQNRHRTKHVAQLQFGLHHAFGAAILLAAITEFSQPALQPAGLAGGRHAAQVGIAADRQIIGDFQGLCRRHRGNDQHGQKDEARAHGPSMRPTCLKPAL